MAQRSYNINKRLNELLATSQNKSYFVGAVTVVFIVIMTMVGILPAFSAFTFQSEENGRRAILIEKLTNKLRVSQALSKEYDSKKDVVNYFGEVFPNSANQEDIIELINDIITSNGASLSLISFNKNPSTAFVQLGYEEQIKSQQVSVAIDGSQSAVLDVIEDIEDSRKIFNIASLNITRRDDVEVTAQNAYVLNLQLEYYFYSNVVSN